MGSTKQNGCWLEKGPLETFHAWYPFWYSFGTWRTPEITRRQEKAADGQSDRIQYFSIQEKSHKQQSHSCWAEPNMGLQLEADARSRQHWVGTRIPGNKNLLRIQHLHILKNCSINKCLFFFQWSSEAGVADFFFFKWRNVRPGTLRRDGGNDDN